jgi:hypothetical protein
VPPLCFSLGCSSANRQITHAVSLGSSRETGLSAMRMGSVFVTGDFTVSARLTFLFPVETLRFVF